MSPDGGRGPKFSRPMGDLNARIHGAVLVMERRAQAARWSANLVEDERAEAALRGKAKAYDEAATILRAIEYGRPLDRSRSKSSRRWKWWR